jgi:hypothetical protein
MDILQKKDGALEVVVDLNEASDVVHLLDVLDEYPEVSASLYVSLGRYSDLRRVAEELGERRARVLLRPGLAQLPYTVQWVNPAADLARAGCRPVFLPPSDEPEGFRTVRRDLAGLVRSGLSERTALLGLTLEPARLLGVADRAGSIERGKDADLCFLDGHPLDPLSTVTRVMVRGELVWNGENP